jgi:hypothetical protein
MSNLEDLREAMKRAEDLNKASPCSENSLAALHAIDVFYTAERNANTLAFYAMDCTVCDKILAFTRHRLDLNTYCQSCMMKEST